MSYKKLDRTTFTELLAEYTLDLDEQSERQLVDTTAAVLSVGGGVGLYVSVPDPTVPVVPTDRSAYSIGYIRAVPLPGRLTVNKNHRHDVYSGQGDDETTHLVAAYQNVPVHLGEVVSMQIEKAQVLDHNAFREFWFLDAFGPLPPIEIFERGVNALDVKRYPHYFYGPGYRIASSTRCRHEYFLTDSCPGCDADEERREGPWAGVTELDYV